MVEVEVQKILVVPKNYDPPKTATKYDRPPPKKKQHIPLAKTYSKFHNQFGWCGSHAFVGFFLCGTARKVIFFLPSLVPNVFP